LFLVWCPHDIVENDDESIKLVLKALTCPQGIALASVLGFG